LLDGITPLTSANQPTFAKARAFVEQCAAVLDADGQLPVARFAFSHFYRLAPYVCVLGVIGEGEDFEVRLAGTRLVAEFLGADPTGKKLSQILSDDEFGKRSWHIVRETVRTKCPVLNQPGRTRLKTKDYMRLETVNYPLVDATGRVVKVASFYDYIFEKQPATV
jgi:hypothetical protein